MERWRQAWGSTRKVFFTTLGFTLLLSGVILSLPLVPGPGILLVLAGLAVLSREYVWADKVISKVRRQPKATDVTEAVKESKGN